jgi:elongin-C
MDSLTEENLLDDIEVEDPRKNLVKLVSKDGHEFLCDKSAVMASGTIRAMLMGPGVWKEETNAVPTLVLESINTPILEKVIQYFYWKRNYDHTALPLPEFPIDVNTIVPLLTAASFLDT